MHVPLLLALPVNKGRTQRIDLQRDHIITLGIDKKMEHLQVTLVSFMKRKLTDIKSLR